jgi:hypothetical protein
MATFENAPLPPELLQGTPLREELEFRQLSRRKVLVGGSLVLGAALAPVGVVSAWNAVDDAVNSMVYPGTESPIVTLGYGRTPARKILYAEEAANIYAGLGQRAETAHKMAVKLAGTPYNGKRLSYNEYANQGLDVENQTDEYEDLEQTLFEEHVFCNSMGSVTWANVMGKKHERAVNAAQGSAIKLAGNQPNPHAPRHLKTLTFCGSPLDSNDVYQSKAVKIISDLALNGTLTEKFLTKLVLAIRSNKDYGGIKDMLESAANDAFDALPPKMWASQVCQLGATGIQSFVNSYAGAIDKDTLVMYLRPIDPRADSVVKVDQAAGRIGHFFSDNFGCKFQEIMLKDAGHADIDRACECAQFEDLLNAKSGLHI